jgi:ferric-dicitrate binding protein FerR (iron transport regulator)
MSGDYLWDGSGEPDPEVARLERLLAPLRYESPGAKLATPRRGKRRLLVALAVAALVLVGAGLALWWYAWPRGEAWDVEILAGSPRVNEDPLSDGSRLRRGQWLSTDDNSRAELAVARIGREHIEPNTRVQLLDTRLTEHRLHLERGRMHARIWAPPRLFYVDTPSAEAIDLGCAYTLEVDEQKRTFLHVEHGYVALNYKGKELIVHAGAVCETRPDRGPGTPHDEECTVAFRKALSQVDFEAHHGNALTTLLAEAKPGDAFTLWHLLSRVTAEWELCRIHDRLAELSPPPADVTRDGILRLDAKMLESWKQSIGW